MLLSDFFSEVKLDVGCRKLPLLAALLLLLLLLEDVVGVGRLLVTDEGLAMISLLPFRRLFEEVEEEKEEEEKEEKEEEE